MAVNDVLNNLQSTSQDDGITVQDVNSFVPQDLSPEQQQAFQDQQNASEPATGPLGMHDYYPTMNQPTNVGNYSGSVIGSTTLFAPGGAVVPLAMIDAREKAIQQAALAKAKEVDAFRNSFKAPTSKLVNINPELTKQYTGFLDDSWKKALAKAGGNGNKAKAILENDPNFNQREKSYRDLAKYGDEIVSKWAQDDEDIKTGKFTPTPKYLEAKKTMLTALDPTHKDFQKLGDTFRTMKVERDFSNAYNTIVDKMVQNQTANAYDVNSPEFIKVRENTIKSWTPEQKQAVAEQMKTIYNGSDYYTPSKIDSDLKTMMSGKVETKKLDVKERRAPGEGESDYSTAAPVSQTAFNVNAGAGGPVGQIHSEKSYKTTADDEKKKINVSLHKDNVDTQGNKVGDQAGQVEGTVSHAFLGYYNQVQKRFLNPEEVKALKEGKIRVSHDIIAKPAIMFTPEKGQFNSDQEGPGAGMIIDADQVKGKYTKKGASKQGFDDKIKELEQDAANENAKRKGTGWPAQNVTNKTVTNNAAPATDKPKARTYKGLDKAGNPIFE